MKTLLKLFVFASVVVLIAIGCRKILSKENSQNTSFNTAFVQNWYYGTFVKSSEAVSVAEKDKKLPDWRNGVKTMIGKQEAVEYPLNKARSSYSIAGDAGLTAAECKKIAAASVAKVAFIKKADNTIDVTEFDYIPDWQYLQKKQFNIGTIVTGIKNDFTGRVVVKKWDGSVVYSKVVVDGKTTKIGKKTTIDKNNFGNGASTSSVSCSTQQFCTYQQDCTITIYGDGSETDECGPWYNTGDCWDETVCSGDDGGGDGGGGGGSNPPPEPQCNMSSQDATDAINSITFDGGLTSTSQFGSESAPDATGIIRAPKIISWDFLYMKYGGDPHALGWSASFSGIIYKNTPNAQWKWESFSYTSTTQTTGTVPICFSISVTPNVSQPVLSTDKLKETVSLSYTAIVTISCLAGVQVGTPQTGSFTKDFLTYE